MCRCNAEGDVTLTVERGKIVVAEFIYGGTLAPRFPAWLVDGKLPSRLAWLLKERILPRLLLGRQAEGREWTVKPELEDS